MNELKFNSQICTTQEQSQRLLDLGLKPETADMHITNMSTKGISYTDNWQIGSTSYKEVMHFWYEKGLKFGDTAWEIIPAWSLHRLIEILDSPLLEFNTLYYNPYEEIIYSISECIKNGYISKEYLKQ